MAQLKAAIYLRISQDPKMTGEAIERQREDCYWMCKHYDYHVVEEYIDQSVSAYSGVHREAYERMITDYLNGKIDVIVAWKLDRLSRSTQNFATTLNEVADQGLCICTTDTGYLDLSRADAKLMATMFIAFAEFESARKSERQIRANEQRAKEGRRKKCIRAYGYNPDYSINEEKAFVVKAIYSAVAKGYSIESIVRTLGGSGEVPEVPQADPPKKKSKKWYSSTIKTILRNPTYAGFIVYAPSKEWAKRGMQRRWVDFIVKDEHGNWKKSIEHEAVVDEATWLAVQNILNDPARDKNRCGNNRKNLGSNLYRCGICGQTVRATSTDYRCAGHVSRKKHVIDGFIRDLVVQRLSDEKLIDMYKRQSHPDVQIITKEIDKYRNEINEYFSLVRRRILRIEEYAVLRDDIEKQILKLEEQRREILSEDNLDEIFNSENPAQAFLEASIVQQTEIVDALMTVTLYKHPAGCKKFDASDVKVEWK